jgi:hypothetical protein
MKPMTALGLGLALFVGGLAFHGGAAAQNCPSGCGLQVKACLQTARVAKLACKMDCRTNTPATGLGACMRACTGTFRSGKDTCRSTLADCIGSCTPPSPPPSDCVGGCGAALAVCARDVVAQARACVQGCRTTADRLACLRGCAGAAHQGGEMCAGDFSLCLQGCGVPPPPRLCGLSGPACDGACPDGLVCQPPPPGSVVPLACLCRRPSSPSGAFLN